MADCLFCALASGSSENPNIYDAELFFAVLDAHPVSPGYALLIPKRHIVDFVDLNDEEMIALRNGVHDIINLLSDIDLAKIYNQMILKPSTKNSAQFCERMLRSPFIGKKPDAYNMGINDGRAAGRTINHLHIHIIPRFIGDQGNHAGGIRKILGEGAYN